MTGKQAKQIRARWQFTLGATFATLLCLISGWVVFHRLTLTAIDPVSIDPLTSPNSELKATDRPTPAPGAQPIPTPLAQPTAPSAAKPTIDQPLPGKVALRQGVFRVGNPTSYPVRVALLPQKTVEAKAAKAGESRYELPAHWDFAPEEGGAEGLLVSLPDRTLKLKKGDILMAFAQDGSGRYWGPYVVDETTLPTWDAKAAEWQLILQP